MKEKKIIIALMFVSVAALSPALAGAETVRSLAQADDGFGFGNTLDTVANVYNPSTQTSLEDRLSVIIATVLSLLGVIFLILMLYAGYNWMTAAGDEEKVKKATATIRAAILGLIIVIASYAISMFVIDRIWGSANPPSGPAQPAQPGTN